MWWTILTSIPFIFLICLLTTLFLFWMGGKFSVKGRKTPDKLAPYACGEDLPPYRPQVNVQRYFIYGLYFLIFDAFAFFLALSFAHPGLYPIIFAVIALIAILVMIPMKWS